MDSLCRTEEAVEKLTEFINTSNNAKAPPSGVASLFGDTHDRTNTAVDIEIAFLKAPVAHRVPLYFSVPNELTWGSICFITPPPEETYKKKILALSEDGDEVAQRVKRVVDTKQLDKQLGEPVAIRAFAKSFNNFVLYGVKKYPKCLTGEFLGHSSMPVWVPKKGTFAESVTRATRTAVVPRRGQNIVVCRVGHSGLSNAQITENVKTLVEKLTRHHSGSPMENILHIRVAATNQNGNRVKLPIFGQKIDLSKEAVARPVKRTLRGKRPLSKREDNNKTEKRKKVEASSS